MLRDRSQWHAHQLLQEGLLTDPYPFYAKLRQRGLTWIENPADQPGDGVWMVSRYADVQQVFKLPVGITKELRHFESPRAPKPFDLNVLFRDGADHVRLRHLIKDFFAPPYVQRFQPLMRATAERLLQTCQEQKHIDFVSCFAEPFPLLVMAAIFGVPVTDLAQIRAWSSQLAVGFDSFQPATDLFARQRVALTEFSAYVAELVRDKRRTPDQGLLSFLVHADRTLLDTDELHGMLAFLLFAGHETTVSLLGSMLWLLLSHPQQWQGLQQQPALVGSAIEECLRFESPEQRSSFRVTTQTIEIAGQTIPPQQRIALLIGSANRDEAVFASAADFDIRRSPNPHLAFGTGRHNCLGRPLARLEAAVVLRVCIESAAQWALLQSNAEWRENSFFRSLTSLPMQLG